MKTFEFHARTPTVIRLSHILVAAIRKGWVRIAARMDAKRDESNRVTSMGKFNGRIYWLECHSCGHKLPEGAVGVTNDRTNCCQHPEHHIHSRAAEYAELGPKG